MSSRRTTSPRFYLAIVSAALFAGGGGFAMSACSSTTTDAPSALDAASEAAVDSGRVKVEAGPDDTDAAKPETAAQCVARCRMEHAGSTAKYDAVDTCWAGSCQGPCVDDTKMFDGGLDGAAFANGQVTDGGGLCGTVEGSGRDIACDNCTTEFCCSEWKGCYGDKDCLALETCFGDCPQ